jgi:methyl-accepting chemotaxis protein
MKYGNKKVVSKGRRKKEKIKAAQKFAEKTVNKEDEIQNSIHEKAEAVKDSAVHAAREAGDFVKDVHEKTQGVVEDMRDGLHEISRDMHETADNISEGFNKNEKQQ